MNELGRRQPTEAARASDRGTIQTPQTIRFEISGSTFEATRNLDPGITTARHVWNERTSNRYAAILPRGWRYMNLTHYPIPMRKGTILRFCLPRRVKRNTRAPSMKNVNVRVWTMKTTQKNRSTKWRKSTADGKNSQSFKMKCRLKIFFSRREKYRWICRPTLITSPLGSRRVVRKPTKLRYPRHAERNDICMGLRLS